MRAYVVHGCEVGGDEGQVLAVKSTEKQARECAARLARRPGAPQFVSVFLVNDENVMDRGYLERGIWKMEAAL